MSRGLAHQYAPSRLQELNGARRAPRGGEAGVGQGQRSGVDRQAGELAQHPLLFAPVKLTRGHAGQQGHRVLVEVTGPYGIGLRQQAARPDRRHDPPHGREGRELRHLRVGAHRLVPVGRVCEVLEADAQSVAEAFHDAAPVGPAGLGLAVRLPQCGEGLVQVAR
jgi:hypothetical protein